MTFECGYVNDPARTVDLAKQDVHRYQPGTTHIVGGDWNLGPLTAARPMDDRELGRLSGRQTNPTFRRQWTMASIAGGAANAADEMWVVLRPILGAILSRFPTPVRIFSTFKSEGSKHRHLVRRHAPMTHEGLAESGLQVAEENIDEAKCCQTACSVQMQPTSPAKQSQAAPGD